MADTDDNMMKQFAPALIGVGLLASTFWLGNMSRRLPSEFRGLSSGRFGGRYNMTKTEAYQAFKNSILPELRERYEQDGIPDKPARREAWNDFLDNLIRSGDVPRSAERWTHPRGLETTRG